MNPDAGRATATRLRIALLAVLGAVIWLLLSVFGAGSSAMADESTDPGSLLGTVIGTVEESSPVPAVTEPVTAVVHSAVEPLTPAVGTTVPTPVAEVAQPTLGTVVNEVIAPVLQRPVIAETVLFLNGAVAESTAQLELSSLVAGPSP